MATSVLAGNKHGRYGPERLAASSTKSARQPPGEIEFVALPNRSVTTATAIVPKNYASLFVALGLRLKFAPAGQISPWVAIGGGYALYQLACGLKFAISCPAIQT